MLKTSFIAATLFAGVLALQPAQAQFIDPFEGQTGGQTAYNYWWFNNSVYNNNATTDAYFKGYYGASPGSAAWGRGAASFEGTAGHYAELIKTSGNLYIGGTLYAGGYSYAPGTFGATAEFNVATALVGVQTITLQWTITSGLLSDIQAGPTLYINGDDSNGLEVDFSRILARVEEPPFDRDGVLYPNYTTTYYYQWTLGEEVTSFDIAFQMEQHARIYEAQIDQSTIPLPIPEPSTYALIGLGLAGAAFLRRRKRTA